MPEAARRLRGAAGEDALPAHDALIRMVRRWEREGLRTERHELLYRALGFGKTPDAPAEAAAADAYWDAGGGRVTATWAQVRAGAAMARLLQDSLDGAAGELAPVLDLPPEQRIRTVTGYLDEVSGMLQAPRFASSPLAAGLREQISDFNAPAAGEGP